MKTNAYWVYQSMYVCVLGFATFGVLGCDDDVDMEAVHDGGAGQHEQDAQGSEAPASCSILSQVVGEYAVTGPATGNDQRGASTADHMRGTISVAADFAIDFDADVAFAADEIMTCYDRTEQDFDRRIQVSYDADDSGRVINLYLSDALEVEEVQYRHSNDGVNIRAAVQAR